MRALLLVSLLAGLWGATGSDIFKLPNPAESKPSDEAKLEELDSLADSCVACLEGRSLERSEQRRLRITANQPKSVTTLFDTGRWRSPVTHPQSYYPWSYTFQISDRAPPRLL